MKRLILLLCLVLVGCSQPDSQFSSEFIKNSDNLDKIKELLGAGYCAKATSATVSRWPCEELEPIGEAYVEVCDNEEPGVGCINKWVKINDTCQIWNDITTPVYGVSIDRGDNTISCTPTTSERVFYYNNLDPYKQMRKEIEEKVK